MFVCFAILSLHIANMISSYCARVCLPTWPNLGYWQSCKYAITIIVYSSNVILFITVHYCLIRVWSLYVYHWLMLHCRAIRYVIKSRLYCRRNRLKIFHEPPATWYKDEVTIKALSYAHVINDHGALDQPNIAWIIVAMNGTVCHVMPWQYDNEWIIFSCSSALISHLIMLKMMVKYTCHANIGQPSDCVTDDGLVPMSCNIGQGQIHRSTRSLGGCHR